MQSSHSMEKGWRAFLDRFIPQDCQLCGAAGSGRHALCNRCLADLPWLEEGCPCCAMPAPGSALCGQCLKHPPHFDATVAALRYAYPADRLILELKYGARLPLAQALGGILAGRAPTDRLPDIIMPMPLHPSRLAERGFNQALEMARPLASTLGRPLVAHGAVRQRDTAHQADLPADRRHANVKGAFGCSLDLAGLTVAIVDDVMTTGASLDELAHTLKKSGAIAVHNWVVARTWPGQI